MSIKTECPMCFKKYNKKENIPYILGCGDTMCLKCINYFKEKLQKTEFQCPECCDTTKSSGIIGIINDVIPLDDVTEKEENKDNSTDGFFEIMIKPKIDKKFSIKVKKEYTIDQVKGIIKKEKDISPLSYNLAFKTPLTDLNKTLEFYKITQTVTLIQMANLQGGII
jgi:hypothetical protein